MQSPSPLKQLLLEAGTNQRELADGISRSDALVSRLISGEARPNKDTIDATLAFLSKKLRRAVTYEETFGEAPEPAASRGRR